MPRSYTNIKKHGEKKGEIEFEAEIPVETIEEYADDALADFAANFEMQGFRKGNVPHDIVRKHVGEMELLERSANEAVRAAIRELIADESLSVLGMPQITITKLAPKNPLAFKATFALTPTITLPDYKAIAKKIREREDSHEVSEKDVDDAIDRLRKMLASQMKPSAPANDGEPAPLPEFNDEFVKQLGPFENVGAFRTELKKNLTKEKEVNVKDVKRDEMIREIVKATKVAIPQLLVSQELEGFIERRDAELAGAGLTLDEYLKQTNKTKDILEKEEHASIEEQIKMSLVFAELRKQEHIVPDEKEVQLSMLELKHRYPDRDEASLREHAAAASIQKKLFEILEGSEETSA
jgi:FKBP-type peptidyl-prolyl cis-trans isomerase (trigger factor)